MATDPRQRERVLARLRAQALPELARAPLPRFVWPLAGVLGGTAQTANVDPELTRALGIGAAALNEMVPKGVALLPENERPVIVHQAGAKHLAQLEKNYEEAGVRANCVAFVDDMAGAYEWADLVICRAGALTVAELAAAGIASILVPFPFAVDDHQTSNARFLASAGGAVLLPQNEMTPESVSLLRNYSRGQLLQMAEKARELARPQATADVAQACAELARKGGSK